MTGAGHVHLRHRQCLTLRHTQLLLDDIDAARFLGHRMFDLQAGIHLDEIESAVFVEEFERSYTAIADLLTRLDAGFADRADQCFGNTGSRRFLDHFLVTALHGAITMAKPDGISMRITQDLNFDMARMLEEFLHVERRRSKGLACFFTGQGHGFQQLCLA
ncbi:hypothetical protein D3C71_928030 [compost metagenome]